MSTTKFLRASLIASVGVAGLTLTANAQSRYGNVYDYESGKNCGQACVAPAPQTPAANSRYGAPVVAAPTYNPAPVYMDCQQVGTCAPQAAVVYTQPAPVYTQPAPVYSQPSYSAPSYAQAAPVNCPAGTTAQSDGTCLQGSSSYGTGSYSSGSTSTYTPSTSYDSTPVSCPAGTTAQSDGTCLQGASGSMTMEMTTMPATVTLPGTYNSASVSCPAGTTAQSDGTCLQGTSGFTGATVELYQGDASTQSTGSYGYTGGTYTSGDYLPIRK